MVWQSLSHRYSFYLLVARYVSLLLRLQLLAGAKFSVPDASENGCGRSAKPGGCNFISAVSLTCRWANTRLREGAQGPGCGRGVTTSPSQKMRWAGVAVALLLHVSERAQTWAVTCWPHRDHIFSEGMRKEQQMVMGRDVRKQPMLVSTQDRTYGGHNQPVGDF